MNKAEYTNTVTKVQRLLLNCQPNYNNNRQYQYQGIRNQLMLEQREKTGYSEGEIKDEENPS